MPVFFHWASAALFLKRQTRIVMLHLAAVALLLAVGVLPVWAADEASVKRGEGVFNAADCAACHTDVKGGGQPLAGGRSLDTAFGRFYAPNITPDKQYGIGAWSEAQFHRALRKGRGRGGEYLFPVFPIHRDRTDRRRPTSLPIPRRGSVIGALMTFPCS